MWWSFSRLEYRKKRTDLQTLHPKNILDFSPNLLKSPIFIFAGVYHNMTPTQRMHYYCWEIPPNDQQHFCIMFDFARKHGSHLMCPPLFCGPVLVFTVWQRIVIIGHVHLVSTRWSLRIADRVATPAMTSTSQWETATSKSNSVYLAILCDQILGTIG